MSNYEDERLRRWRLILGSGVACQLNKQDSKVDQVLAALYGRTGKGGSRGGTLKAAAAQSRGSARRGGTEDSAPSVSRWLGDIRSYFPASVVQVMQRDAIELIGLRNLLTSPEILESIDPDVDLIGALLMLKDVIPSWTKATARVLVRRLVDDLIQRLESPMRQAVRGALNRSIRNRRPRHREIDWNRTVRANLKHYLPEKRTVIPETLIGYGRKRNAIHDVIICIDESGSMASSLVYASIFGAVMASIPALNTHLVVFDTSVVDLTTQIHDPVDVLFGATLGGGTDINQALAYCQQLVVRPQDTTFVLISDLFDGGDFEQTLVRAGQLVNSGVQFTTLLALDDRGAPSFSAENAGEFAKLGVVSFACTPDLFPELMAATMNRKDISQWAGEHDIKVSRPKDHHSTSR